MCAVQLEIRNVTKTFEPGLFAKKPRPVLKNISFQVHSGRTFGIVGESGTGKSTLAKIMVGLEKATSGEIYFRGKSLERMKKEALSGFRRQVQMLFQDPEGSLNPKKTIQKTLYEILDLIGMPKKDYIGALENILQTVGLSQEILGRYPSQISGGQNQRIALARILLLEPEIIILDEPTSALDISVQAQILNLLKGLQKQKNLTYVFISHDKEVIRFMCHDIATLAEGFLTIPADKTDID
jgi:peptide/nickel transport system ATP-binding protein